MTINQEITPGKSDEELLSLVTERKKIEDQLEELSRKLVASEGASDDAESPSSTDRKSSTEPEEEPESEKREVISQRKQRVPTTVVEKESRAGSPGRPTADDETDIDKAPPTPVAVDTAGDFGAEGIAQGTLEEPDAFGEYLEQIKAHPASIGNVLQEMPSEAKQNKSLMLKIAALDPAYAMHYADKETLKKDEDFNIRVAGMKNPRNSGNALAEMLPECRTEKVVLAGVRQDFRNIRFASPAMDGYEHMLELAKQGALEKVRELGQGVSPEALIPRVLQKDETFMQEVKRVLSDAETSQFAPSHDEEVPQYTQKSPWSIRHSGL